MTKGKDLKPHIGIFGRSNTGKSSFINVLTGQNVSIVSKIPGTTTDPVKKSVEIFGIGPVVIIDTAGIDDTSDLGTQRIEKTLGVLKTIDCAVLIIAENTFSDYETDLLGKFKDYEIPFLIIHNKSDIEKLKPEILEHIRTISNSEIIEFSALNKMNTDEIIEGFKRTIPETSFTKPSLLKGLVKKNDIVLLVTPVDNEAPEGRMILPQVMTWRNVLDNDCICISVKESELEKFMSLNIRPSLVITDSQAFKMVSTLVPENIPLTGFSILFARIKGNFEEYIKGTPRLAGLKDGERVLIMESCTHQVNCSDIGRHKLPDWIRKFTGKNIEFDFVSGLSDIGREINSYAMVIQCGGCMLTGKQLENRLKPFIDKGIPVSNYGMSIAFLNKIFERSIKLFCHDFI